MGFVQPRYTRKMVVVFNQTSLDNKEQYSKGRNDLEWLCVEDQRRGFLNHRFVSSTFRFQNEKYYCKDVLERMTKLIYVKENIDNMLTT